MKRVEDTSSIWLEEVELNSAAQAVCAGQAGARAFQVHGEFASNELIGARECLLVAPGADTEPGDWVVWSHGNCASLALAEISESLELVPLVGFLGPQIQGQGSDRLARSGARIEGVVIARLRPAIEDE